VKTDTTTQGSWLKVYGGNGYGVANMPAAYPSYAQVALASQNSWTWADGSSDVRAIQKTGASDRIASTWFADSSFKIDVNLTDGASHQVALYMLDWDNNSRTQRVDLLDYTTGVSLDSRSVSGFSAGQYLVWNLKGHVTIQVTNLGGVNAVASGIFFGPGSTAPTSSAAFVNVDTKTQGAWKGSYGANGAIIAGDASVIPAFAKVAFANQNLWTWDSSTSDSRALQIYSGRAKQRIASAWYGDSFTIDVNLTDGKSHQIALYLLDWDSSSRTETLTVSDAVTGLVLDTRNASSFSAGQYLVWNLTGHVVIKVTSTGGPNAVVNGIFF